MDELKYSPAYDFEVHNIIRVIDGDTILAWIKLPFDTMAKMEIRFSDIDTWEARNRKGRSKEHVEKGLAATKYLRGVLEGQIPVKDPSCAKCHYLLPDRNCTCKVLRPWKRVWVRSHKNKSYMGNFGRYLFQMFLEDDDGNVFSVSNLLRKHGFEKNADN